MKKRALLASYLRGSRKPPASVLAGQQRVRANASELLYQTLLLILIALPTLAFSQDSAHRTSHDENPYVISVSVNMVVLHATVENEKHVSVGGLDKKQFQIYENGALQQIKQFSHDDIPVTVGLVVDNSGSMRTKRSAVIAAAMAFARSSNGNDQIFVVNFNEKVSFALPVNIPFTDDKVELGNALSQVVANGETALYDAIDVALIHLNKGDRDKKVLIVISDGGDNASKHTLEQVIALARRSSAIIYSVGIFEEQDEDKNPAVLRRFAEETGGESYFPDTVNEVIPICERVARDIRSQYTLGYTPSDQTQDGSYRAIRVSASTADHVRLWVRTRPGYFAPLATPSPTTKASGHESH
jgi:VWFA-related protein